MPDVDELERQRQENIRANEELLRQLNLSEAAASLNIPSASTTKGKKSKAKGRATSSRASPSTPSKERKKPVQPRKKTQASKVVESTPRRTSSRLSYQHAAADETPREKKKRLAELEAKRKREEEERLELLEMERAAKRPRHHDLDINVLLDADGNEEEDEGASSKELAALRTRLEVACREVHSRRVGDEDSEQDERNREREAVDDLKDKLNSMVIKSRAKVTQDRVYSMAYHPERSKDLVFVGDKHGQLGIWDALGEPEPADDDEEPLDPDTAEGGRYWRLQPHWPKTSKSSISCIKFNPQDGHSVLTSAYDCTLRSTSFVSSISTEIFSLASSSTILTSFDLSTSGNEIWISDASGGLSHVDLREGAKSERTRRQVNAKEKIGCVSVNPLRDHLLLTASNDHAVKIWDTRNLTKIACGIPDGEDDDSAGYDIPEADFDAVEAFLASKTGKGKTILAEYEHGQSASSAFWDPSGRRIVSTSYDNYLRVWDVGGWMFGKNARLKTFEPNKKINHNCKTGKWVTVFKAQWSPNPDVLPYFTVGNMNHSLDFYAHDGELLAKLEDRNKITAVQAVTCTHPSIVERAATGNASGRCVLWGSREDE